MRKIIIKISVSVYVREYLKNETFDLILPDHLINAIVSHLKAFIVTIN